MARITLYHFPASHYNEKARWALDLKRVPHDRIPLLPGPHAPRMLRLTGRTQTPALVEGEQVVPGSAAILAHLEQRFPDPHLEPSALDERARALEIAARFDDEVGPAIRLAMFYEVMSATYASNVFGTGRSALAMAAYRASFPLVFRVMKRSMGIEAEAAARALERTRQALDFVAKEAGAEGYLVGGRFGIADLTCAALLMPALDVSHLGGPTPAGTAEERAWYARWADHPGTAWVREIYRRHRSPSQPA